MPRIRWLLIWLCFLANAIGYIDRDLFGAVDPRHSSDDPAAGNDTVAAPQGIQHRLVIFRLSLLWANQQKIEYDKDQDKRQKLDERVLIKHSRTLGIGRRNQHGYRASESWRRPCRRRHMVLTGQHANWYAMPGQRAMPGSPAL